MAGVIEALGIDLNELTVPVRALMKELRSHLRQPQRQHAATGSPSAVPDFFGGHEGKLNGLYEISRQLDRARKAKVASLMSSHRAWISIRCLRSRRAMAQWRISSTIPTPAS